MSVHPFFECVSAECHLRFPAYGAEERAASCPMCGSPTKRVAQLDYSYLVPPEASLPATRRVVALLDNIRSANNVGAIFRTADGAGLAHVYLCGITATPENNKVKKTALGSEQAVAWTHERNSLRIATKLKAEGVTLVALEGGSRARSLASVAAQLPSDQTVGLVVGNEISGVDPDLLALCDAVVGLPMRGVKQSLNVAVAFGVAAYGFSG